MYYGSVKMYGLIIGLAVVILCEIAKRVYIRLGGDGKELERLSLGVIVGSLVGARAYHVIDYWEYYQERLVEVFYLWNGGLGIWGALIGGTVVLFVAQKHFASELKWRMFAAILVALPLAQAIGRLANYFNGEFGELVMGLPWWSVEMILNLMLFKVMWFALLRGETPKFLVGTYLIGYGGIRMILESFREIRWEIGGLPVASYIAIFAIIMGIWLIRNVPDSCATLKGKKT